MADTLGGMGLWMADRALEIFTNDPKKLDRARSRFDKPPPLCRSIPSGTTTRSPSPDPLNEEQRWIADQRVRLEHEHQASLASEQFSSQVSEEKRRVFAAISNRILHVPIGKDFWDFAQENVKKRWIEQDIWDDNWEREGRRIWRWKHEKPLKTGLKSYTELQTKLAKLSSLVLPEYSEPKAIEQGGEDETQKIEKAPSMKECEHDASRPFYQFVYQMSKEREWIQERLRHDGSTAADADDINTTVYQKVKDTWTKREIWNRKWGVMPGMSWKHEQPLGEWIEQEMSENPYSQQISLHERDNTVDFNEISLKQYRSVSSSPAEPNQQVSSVTNPAHQVLPMAINPSGSPNTVHNSPCRHTTPLPPPREKKRRGRPPRGSEKCRPDLQLQDCPAPLRRSKRLLTTQSVAVPDTVIESKSPVGRRGRPKRGGTNVDISTQSFPAQASRPSKRQRRTRK
ncbi:hypothetical protein F4782DRAFT_532647 [Xylaria castorea]|nr:hypothetical protein F4782DRAFT_532647 [Xylaria castorea]